MVIKSPKNKRSAGEREVILLLTTWATQVGVALHLERNLEQTRYGHSEAHWPPYRREDHGPDYRLHISTNQIGDTP